MPRLARRLADGHRAAQEVARRLAIPIDAGNAWRDAELRLDGDPQPAAAPVPLALGHADGKQFIDYQNDVTLADVAQFQGAYSG